MKKALTVCLPGMVFIVFLLIPVHSFWRSNGVMETLAGLILLIIVLVGMAVYFLPSVIAIIWKKRNHTAIFLLNLLLGWTVLGWIGALIWSIIIKPPTAEA